MRKTDCGKTEEVDHYVVVLEPNSNYLGHIAVETGSANRRNYQFFKGNQHGI